MTMTLPILAGRLRGKKWLILSGGKILRVLLGSYEREQTALFERFISPGSVILDIGAHVGYYTLLASELTGPEGHVYAFEPEPKNISFLRRHIEINAGANVTVIPAAVGDSDGTAQFDYGTGTGTGHISETGKISVPIITLDRFCAQRNLFPTHLKIDVEGAEMRVLDGGRETLRRHRPVLFLSTHGPQVHEACLTLLTHLHYNVEAIVGDDLRQASEILCLPD